MPAIHPASPVTLEFDPARLTIGGEDLRRGLSAVVRDGSTIWLACDEGCRIERLSQASDGRFAAHEVFALQGLLTLPADPDSEEADIEGLDVDGGWLWLVGSHSRKRKQPKVTDSPDEVAAKLAKTERDGNRHLLARIPLVANRLQATDGSRRAGSIGTSINSSALLKAIVDQRDPHLLPWVELPGKDNGLDIEGLAVDGSQVLIGLRGPVLREWCCIIELRLEADASGDLRLSVANGAPYKKHFLKLGGLGIRDLTWLDDDLLILAGPPMAHDGPAQVWRWKNATRAGNSPEEATRVLVLPQAELNDKAEGLTIFETGAASTTLLVAYDSPSEARLERPHSVIVDVYRLP